MFENFLKKISEGMHIWELRVSHHPAQCLIKFIGNLELHSSRILNYHQIVCLKEMPFISEGFTFVGKNLALCVPKHFFQALSMCNVLTCTLVNKSFIKAKNTCKNCLDSLKQQNSVKLICTG